MMASGPVREPKLPNDHGEFFSASLSKKPIPVLPPVISTVWPDREK
jgi:hypothetical protein